MKGPIRGAGSLARTIGWVRGLTCKKLKTTVYCGNLYVLQVDQYVQ